MRPFRRSNITRRDDFFTEMSNAQDNFKVDLKEVFI